MTQDNVVKLIQPAEFSDPLTEVLREGARALLAQAVEAEVAAFAGCQTEKSVGPWKQPCRLQSGLCQERLLRMFLSAALKRAWFE